MKKNVTIWVIAVIITLAAAIYQRSTGPTYPKKFNIDLAYESYSFSLKRSHTITRDFFVEMKNAPENLSGKVVYKPYPTDLSWEEASLIREDGALKAQLPVQPPAGKIEYYLVLEYESENIIVAKEEPVIIRFKGDVPAGFLIPHIIFMFAAMLLANVMGIMVIAKDKRYKKYLNLSFLFLLIGGLVLGPIIQKYAFGDFWTGWPIGKDLTDNKTLVSVVFFIIAYFGNLKKDRPYLALIAAIVILIIYLIPHSMMGSEFDYSTGEVVTG